MKSPVKWAVVLVWFGYFWIGSPVIGDMPEVRHGWLSDIRQAWAIHAIAPAAGSPAKGAPSLHLAAGVGRLHGMTELPQSELGLALDTHGLRADLVWSRVGSDLWRDETLELILGRSGTAGVALILDRCCSGPVTAPDDDQRQSRQGLGLQLGFEPGENCRAWLRYDLLERASMPDLRQRTAWLQIQAVSGRFAPTMLLWRRTGQPPSPAVELQYRPAAGFAAGISCEPAVSTLGFLFCCVHGNRLLRGSHILHPALGVTHRWELIFRFDPSR